MNINILLQNLENNIVNLIKASYVIPRDKWEYIDLLIDQMKDNVKGIKEEIKWRRV